MIGASQGDNLGIEVGSAYVFERDPTDPTLWSQTSELIADDGGPFEDFGKSVAIAGDTAVIGAPQDDNLGSQSGSAYVFEPAGLLLVVQGSCPGPMEIGIGGATPAGGVGVVYGTTPGSFILGGACAGIELGLADPQLLATLTADGEGNITLSPNLPGAACGLYLQALDLTNCEPSNVAQVP